MSLFPSIISSVTRWLLVVVGCVVLETAQPMNAAEPSSPPPAPRLEADRVLYPADSRGAPEGGGRASSGGGSVWVFIVLVGLGSGAFWLWRRRNPVDVVRRGARIVIEDTRALGNRQFLVVAGVDGRRFLLGVAPGNIRLLSPLASEPGAEADDHDDA
jgi:flagellar protein FliO/FliZ